MTFTLLARLFLIDDDLEIFGKKKIRGLRKRDSNYFAWSGTQLHKTHESGKLNKVHVTIEGNRNV